MEPLVVGFGLALGLAIIGVRKVLSGSEERVQEVLMDAAAERMDGTVGESAREAAAQAWGEALQWAALADDGLFQDQPDTSGIQPFMSAQVLAMEGEPAEAYAASRATPDAVGSPAADDAIQRARAASEVAWGVCGSGQGGGE